MDVKSLKRKSPAILLQIMDLRAIMDWHLPNSKEKEQNRPEFGRTAKEME